MESSKINITLMLQNVWKKLEDFPGGKSIFSSLVSYMVPYSGSIRAKVLRLEPGYCKAKLKDRRKIRNHLNCIHALAISNFGEFTSGLALNMGLQNNVRGIVTQINTQYLKKARGSLTGQCRCTIPNITDREDYWIKTEIRNSENELVATTDVCWRLSKVE